ncbi:MAG: iron ABC transporter substrate-binding protein [Caldilineaceae bacterium]|nr:iron ABC transporter substrate-binding protein [Caldilineaceae bacterium]
MRTLQSRAVLFSLLILALLIGACQPIAPSATAPAADAPAAATTAPGPELSATDAPATLVVYSGRNENLVGPLIEQFRAASGIQVDVRYGDTAELAATILEEGQNSPADVYFGQDAGALGALDKAGRFVPLPQTILDQVDGRFRAADGAWVGASGRARVFVYNTNDLAEADLPNSIWELTDPQWKGKVGWAPTNGSFQAFVTALRVLEGEDKAREWLAGMIANETQIFSNNTGIVEAVGRGEVQLGLVNHYYLYRFLAEQGESFPARNHHPTAADAGSIINVAGVGILDTVKNQAAAEQFVSFLLSAQAQEYFASETTEYPLVEGIAINPLLTPLAEISTPAIDLNDLADLQGTLELLQESGALQ